VQSIAKDQRIIDVCLDPMNKVAIKNAESYLVEINTAYPYYENLPIALKLDEPIYRDVNGESVLIENGTFLIDTVNNITLGKGGTEYSYIQEILDGKDYFISEIYPSILRENPIFVVGRNRIETE